MGENCLKVCSRKTEGEGHGSAASSSLPPSGPPLVREDQVAPFCGSSPLTSPALPNWARELHLVIMVTALYQQDIYLGVWGQNKSWKHGEEEGKEDGARAGEGGGVPPGPESTLMCGRMHRASLVGACGEGQHGCQSRGLP